MRWFKNHSPSITTIPDPFVVYNFKYIYLIDFAENSIQILGDINKRHDEIKS